MSEDNKPQEYADNRLVVVCEGGIHTVEYLINNAVIPSVVVLEASKFKDISLRKTDEVLVIIHGLTDFTLADSYALFKTLEERKLNGDYQGYTILSNMDLGKIQNDYFIYTDDLFFGSVQIVTTEGVYDLDNNGCILKESKFSFLLSKKERKESAKDNVIMKSYKKFGKLQKGETIRVYGAEVKHTQVKDSEYESKIVVKDLFS